MLWLDYNVILLLYELWFFQWDLVAKRVWVVLVSRFSYHIEALIQDVLSNSWLSLCVGNILEAMLGGTALSHTIVKLLQQETLRCGLLDY